MRPMTPLANYLQILDRRKWVILAPIVLGAVGAVAATFWIPQMKASEYETSATVRLALAGRSVAGLPPVDATEIERLTNTSIRMIESTNTLSRIADQVGLADSPEELRKRIEISPIAGTELIEIQARSTSAVEAQTLANAVAQAWQEEGSGFYERIGGSQLAVAFTQVQQAPLPESPVEANWLMTIGAGLLIGAFAGIALAVASEYTDRTINNKEDLESLSGLPLLASIPRHRKAGPSAHRSRNGHHAVEAGEMRVLAVRLLHARREQGLSSILFTSPWPRQGTTSIAIGTATAMARSGVEVLLIDANTSDPALHLAFDISPFQPGLTDVVLSRTEADPAIAVREAALESNIPYLSVLTSGSGNGDSWNVLGSVEMRRLVEQYEHDRRLLLIDGPPVFSSPDVLALASCVGGVVMVCAEGGATIDDVGEAVTRLEGLEVNVLGLVYNSAKAEPR